MKTTVKTASSLKEMDRIIGELVNKGFENLGSWEFYNKNSEEKVIVKIKIGF